MVRKAVCLLSGGIDSCVCTFLAKKEGYEIHCLTFEYGQRHQKEIQCAQRIGLLVGAKQHKIFKLDLKQFGGSPLVDSSLDLPQDHDISDIGNSIPPTYVPARNTVFLSIALANAEVIDADSIFIGVSSTDYAGYPDCRPAYIQAFQKMADLATKRGISGRSVKIKTPLLYLTKAEIIKKGEMVGAPLGETWSCYQGSKKACGRCDSCLLRLRGFKEAGSNDPLTYQVIPSWYQ